MLLKKRIITIAILFILLFPLASYAQVCEVEKIKQALRKALYLHFIDEGGSGLTPNEIKDILIFYLTISAQNSTVDCSALGLNSNKPLFDVIGIGENLLDRIPACAEGTKYGECSKIRPSYCYAGAVYEKCGLCGCPTNSVCGKAGKCEALSQNITCFRDIDCGQSEFYGEYYCSNNYIAKNYVNYTCASPGTANSKCMQVNGTTILNYCNPTLNQMCAAGQSTCKLTINDSAPTVAISVSPASAAKGQFFNVTVTGTDDVGLAAIWWWGVNTADAELNKAHWFECNGAKTCKNSWLISTNATGVLTLGANSRDIAYPVAGQPHQASEGAGIAYATVTITEPGTAAVPGLAIKGRLVDKNTLKPVPNIAIFLGTSTAGQALNPIYTNANGEFAASTMTNITSAKMFPYWPKCYHQGFFLLEKRYDGSLNVRLYLFDLVREDKSFAVTGPEVNLGDVPLWPSVDIAVNSDIAVQMNIEFPEEGRGYGNINYKTSHYLSNILPLAYNTRVQLKDQSGNIYYSPYKTYGLENGCAPVTLAFTNKQFIWSGAQAVVNQTANLSVTLHSLAVNGSNLETVYSKNFDTCAHLLTSANTAAHTQNYFCAQGNYISATASLSGFNAVAGQNYKLCHGNNYNICSELKMLANVTPASQSNQSVSSKPDLIISQIAFSPSNPKTTDVLYVNITIKNNGTSAAGSSVLQVEEGSEYWRLSAGNIAAGSSYTLQISKTFSAGSHSFLAKADADGAVSELDEYNNWLSGGVTVAASNQSNNASANQTQPDSCLDSDNGIYPYTKGFAAGYQKGVMVNLSDYCASSTNYIYEAYCGTNITYQIVACSYQCSNGACVNQTAKLCTETNKLINFENPPHLSFHLTWNPDLGTQDSYNYNLDETARNWLRVQGIEITGTPNGIVWGTSISGPVGTTGVVIGDASPSFAENDNGISDNEVLAVRFLNISANSVTVTLTSTPSNVASINNIPTTVFMDAYNSAGSLVATTTSTFTGVTNGTYTPTAIGLSSTDFNIAKITLRTTQYPYGGVWLEDINFKICT